MELQRRLQFLQRTVAPTLKSFAEYFKLNESGDEALLNQCFRFLNQDNEESITKLKCCQNCDHQPLTCKNDGCLKNRRNMGMPCKTCGEESSNCNKATLKQAICIISDFYKLVSKENFIVNCENFPINTFEEFEFCRTFPQIFDVVDKSCLALENFLMKKTDDITFEEQRTWRKTVVFFPMHSLICIFDGCKNLSIRHDAHGISDHQHQSEENAKMVQTTSKHDAHGISDHLLQNNKNTNMGQYILSKEELTKEWELDDLEEIENGEKLEAIFQLCPYLYDISIDQDYSLPCNAVKKNISSIIRVYIERGFDPYQLIAGKSIYHVAAESGNIDILTMLLDYNSKNVANLEDSNGKTTVHYALESKNNDCIKLLFKQEDFDFRMKHNGQTLLTYACFKGLSKIVEYLLLFHKEINVNETDEFIRETALHVACKEGYEECVKLLSRDKRCDVNIVDKNGKTSLYYACLHGHDKCVKRILARKSCKIDSSSCLIVCEKGHIECLKHLINSKGSECFEMTHLHKTSMLLTATRENQVEIVRLLLSCKECDLNAKDEDGKTSLHVASSNGYVGCVKVLLQHKECDVNEKDEDGNTSLHVASRYGKVECVNALLQHKECDVNAENKNGNTSLHVASSNGYVGCLNALLQHKECDVNAKNEKGNKSLYGASSNGKVECVNALLQHKECDVNAKDEKGNTSLHVASSSGYVDCVKVLLQHKECDVNAKDEKGNTSLHVASRYDKVDCVNALLQHECDVNAKDEDGNTSLHVASINGYVDCVKALLQHKECDVNSKNEKGNTSLYGASWVGKVECVKALLQHKECDVNAKNENGNTSLHVASSKGFIKCVRALLNHKDTIVNIVNVDYENPLGVAATQDIKMLLANILREFDKGFYCN